MTVFTPLAIAGRITRSEDMFVQHLRDHPDKLEYALDVITETSTRFGRACLERGASGLYFATTAFATVDRLTPEQLSQIYVTGSDDRLVPLGGVGRRLAVRCFQDARVPRSERSAWPVVEAGGAVAWIPGVCRSARFCPEAGERAVRVEVQRVS